MSLLAREIAIRSYFELISMFVTSAARYWVVAHLRESYRDYYYSLMLSYLRVHKQNLPVLLPSTNPLEKVQTAVTERPSVFSSLKTLWYYCLTSNAFCLTYSRSKI